MRELPPKRAGNCPACSNASSRGRRRQVRFELVHCTPIHCWRSKWVGWSVQLPTAVVIETRWSHELLRLRLVAWFRLFAVARRHCGISDLRALDSKVYDENLPDTACCRYSSHGSTIDSRRGYPPFLFLQYGLVRCNRAVRTLRRESTPFAHAAHSPRPPSFLIVSLQRYRNRGLRCGGVQLARVCDGHGEEKKGGPPASPCHGPV